jgi:hypothetical protein
VGAQWKMGSLGRAGELWPHSGPLNNLEWLRVVRYAEAGDLDTAFEHLHRLIDARDPCLVHLAVAPQWDSLRGDPRFKECLARMKLRPVL